MVYKTYMYYFFGVIRKVCKANRMILNPNLNIHSFVKTINSDSSLSYNLILTSIVSMISERNIRKQNEYVFNKSAQLISLNSLPREQRVERCRLINE